MIRLRTGSNSVELSFKPVGRCDRVFIPQIIVIGPTKFISRV